MRFEILVDFLDALAQFGEDGMAACLVDVEERVDKSSYDGGAGRLSPVALIVGDGGAGEVQVSGQVCLCDGENLAPFFHCGARIG